MSQSRLLDMSRYEPDVSEVRARIKEYRAVQWTVRITFSLLRGASGIFIGWSLLLTFPAQAQMPVEVTYAEGLVHGFLELRGMDGELLAHGDLAQVPHGKHVSSHLVFRFKDGSVHDETVEFSQQRVFKVLNYHLVQSGPVFKVPMDVRIDGSTGEVLIRYVDEDGDKKEESERFELPSDLANGMVPILLKNIPDNATQTTLSIIAATPKPRLVKFVISPEGEAKILAGGTTLKATKYRLKVEIGGVLGLLAPLVGKQPQDSHAWVLGGSAPAFIRLEGPLFAGGPSWRIDLASPVWQDQ